MAFVLSCELSDRVASIGTVAGLFTHPWEACDRTRPVPLIAFHGLDDEIVPFAGGPLDGPGGDAPDVAAWMADLARRNGCATAAVIPADGPLGGTRWSDCDGGADVILHTIADGGHTWPGGDPAGVHRGVHVPGDRCHRDDVGVLRGSPPAPVNTPEVRALPLCRTV